MPLLLTVNPLLPNANPLLILATVLIFKLLGKMDWSSVNEAG